MTTLTSEKYFNYVREMRKKKAKEEEEATKRQHQELVGDGAPKAHVFNY